MEQIITTAQIVLSSLLIFFVLLQVKGVGFGRVWGTGGGSFARRGLEKLVFKLTFAVSGLFILLSIVSLVI
ncbi:MAG: preprotein translocase subunit SecG [Patescibacteria group bacterium]